MKLVPLGDRLVIKQVVAEETTKSGIVLPGQAKEKPQEATVVAVGKGVESDVIKEGDTVIYSKYAGNTIKVDDEEYIIVKEEDVLAILK
ncbi:MAG: co-chaperone GroES [Lachnospiraceae bacterium]